MTAIVLRADARHLPLPDASVDLICCSPPYFGLRSYSDNGVHYEDQIGSEATPAEWLAALLDCTRDWIRVLKPSGSIFVNLGDKYAMNGTPGDNRTLPNGTARDSRRVYPKMQAGEFRPKSLLGLPWRYALACMDELGLILRRDIIWSKPNGLPESVQDRCRSSHEYLFHFTRLPRYYAAVDEIREPHAEHTLRYYGPGTSARQRPANAKANETAAPSPSQLRHQLTTVGALGKLPGSVWEIPSQPLSVPARLGVDHFAAFPMELPRRCILGWSPPGICTECGEGRRPQRDDEYHKVWNHAPKRTAANPDNNLESFSANGRGYVVRTITGYACGCTPYTDHPGTGEKLPRKSYGDPAGLGQFENSGGLWNKPRTGPWREYHLDGWTPPPARPAVVVDPFGGTGTTALVASMLGRTGVSVDLSADYCRLARWRTTDPGERARALQVPKPPPVPDGQGSLFDDLEAS